MQWSLNLYQLALLYIVEYSPYVALTVLLVLGIRDLIKRKLHISTIILLVVTIALFALVGLLARVI